MNNKNPDQMPRSNPVKLWMGAWVAVSLLLMSFGIIRMARGGGMLNTVAAVVFTVFGMLLFTLSVITIIIRLWKAGIAGNLKNNGTANPYRPTLRSGPRIVAIGGGSGLSSLLRAVKHLSANISAIVTVADNGGNSGQLRNDLGVLPPGDIRNCLIALSQVEPSMENLMQYRFKEGTLKGQCFGNLLLVGLSDLNGGFLKGIQVASEVLAIVGKVLPVTTDNVQLRARMVDGTVIEGESLIGKAQREYGGFIDRVWLEPCDCTALSEAVEDILNADIILMGPGSLYTSLIPNLMVPGIVDAIDKSEAVKIFIMNLMTQPGETEGYDAEMHINAVKEHAGKNLFDYYLINEKMAMPEELKQKYEADCAAEVACDVAKLTRNGYNVVLADMAKEDNEKIRHSLNRLAAAIYNIYNRKI